LIFLGLAAGETVCEPVGCERCGGIGYRGRIGVFEAVEIAGELRDRVQAGVDAHALEAAALRSGMTTMTADAVLKARTGATSVAEALRVAAIR
jgi:general secretion pathway protein E